MSNQKIEALYPLTPMQQTFLWHSLESAVDPCLIQMRCTLHGSLDARLLQQSWDWTLRRHPALRSSVHWEKVKQPLQTVFKEAALPWRLLDCRGELRPEHCLQQFLVDDRTESISLTSVPVWRVTLLQIKDEVHELVWTCHHLLLDGWSGALVMDDVLQHYDALCLQLPVTERVAPAFKNFVRWVAQQDHKEAETFWRATLKGFGRATPLPVLPSETATDGAIDNVRDILISHRDTVTLDVRQSAELDAFLRQSRLTLSSIMQGLWAWCLSMHSGRQDVVFGLTVSGRQIALPGAEHMVGMLINLLPVRVVQDNELSVYDWLHGIQSRHFASLAHCQIDPVTMHGWSEVSGALFDSVLVVENQPQTRPLQSLQVSNVQSDTVSNSGMTLLVKPGKQLTLELITRNDANLQNPQIAVTDLLQKLCSILMCIVRSSELSLGELSRQSLAGMMPLSGSVKNPQFEPATLTPLKNAQDTVRSQKASVVARLQGIWEAVLPVQSISPADNFFDLGGTSLQAIRMFTLIESTFGIQLPATTLFKHATLGVLSELLSNALDEAGKLAGANAVQAASSPVGTAGSRRDAQEQAAVFPVTPSAPGIALDKSCSAHPATLVEIQGAGDKTPLFIPDTATDLLVYRHIAERLGPSQPVYAFATRDLPECPIDDLVRRLVDEMLIVQSEGPYYLAGLSGGGLLAWRVVQLLEARGHTVARLFLFDCIGPDYPQLLPPVRRLQSVLLYCYGECCDLLRRRRHVAAVAATSEAVLAREVSAGRGHAVSLQSQLSQRLLGIRALMRTIGIGRGPLEHGINCLIVAVLKLPVYSINIGLPTFLQGIYLSQRDHPSISAAGQSEEEAVSQRSANELTAIRQAWSRMYSGLRPHGAKVIYFRAAQRPPGVTVDPYVGWEALLGDKLEIHEVPGNHLSLIQEPHVGKLAKLLAAELSTNAQSVCAP